MSALSVGLGVGIGLASGQTVSKWTGGANPSSNAITPRIMEQEMLNLIVDGRESQATFDEFPYYLSCFITDETVKEKRKNKEGQNSEGTSVTEEDKEEKVITIRPLNMVDFREAKNQVAASFAAEGSIMSELKQWNDLYGEGGSREKEQLSYFL